MTTTAADCACSPHATAGHCRLPVPTGLPIPPSRSWTLHSPPRPAPEPCLHHRVGSRRPPISRSAPWPPPENSMTAGAAPAPLPARVQSNKVCASATSGLLLFMFNDGRGSSEQLACACDVGGTIAAGEQAIMADAVEAFGQDVGEESSDELVRVQCHCLPPVGSIDAVILPAEGDGIVIGGDQSTIGDGDAVGIPG